MYQKKQRNEIKPNLRKQQQLQLIILNTNTFY